MTTETQRSTEEIRAAISGIRGTYIATKRDSDFAEAFDRLISLNQETEAAEPIKFTSTGETRGIIVVDGAGGGKTSLVQRGLTMHPGLKATETTKPVVSITVPNPATLKSVAQAALKATGYTGGEKKRTTWEQFELLRARFKMLGTVVFWIDEAHDLFPHGSKSEAPHILKTFKSLMQGDGAVIVILSGVESLWDSISFDHQVQRRYSKFELPPVVAATDSKLIWKLLVSFCNRVGLEPPQGADLVNRIFHASRQRFGLCIEQMISAIEIALLRGDAKLDAKHFADAFFAQEACSIADNVFLSPRWSSLKLIA
ncbi:TniB family NTP-binding protein [Sulfitobacter dubius]|uniref:TniB family NTP-binding protein n=1 Tax=Sulfitobacter dubius TaxID=218673 RepID=UPI0022AED643|nr:TniB family NTP-binding protein [Sulfitobacter dubius]MCZ4368835.1 TniB family NTP-binding protein [Sulfitobacter dubius]